MRTSPVCLVTLAALVGSTEAARAECKPAAVAQGDPQLVKDLIAKLAASGIATSTMSGCPAVKVEIEQRGPQVHVKLADAFQRTSERDVQDLSTAAAVIESWMDQEIEPGSLPAVEAVAAPVEPPHVARTGIAASAMSAIGSNGGTTWIGGSISGCLRFGPTCAGAALRAAIDTHVSGDTSPLAQTSYALSAIATIDLPQRVGGFVVSPGIGVGYGFLHVTTTHHDLMGNPLDIPSWDHQLRTAAHAALLVPWGDHVSAFADLWTDAALLRSDSQFGPTASLLLSLGIRLEAP